MDRAEYKCRAENIMMKKYGLKVTVQKLADSYFKDG